MQIERFEPFGFNSIAPPVLCVCTDQVSNTLRSLHPSEHTIYTSSLPHNVFGFNNLNIAGCPHEQISSTLVNPSVSLQMMQLGQMRIIRHRCVRIQILALRFTGKMVHRYNHVFLDKFEICVVIVGLCLCVHMYA